MKYDITHIKQLLDDFYRGETTPAQERELSAYFAETPAVPEELESDRRLFLSLSEAAIPEGLEESLIKMIDRQSVRSKMSPLRRWAKMVAAVAVVGLGVGTIVRTLHHEVAPIAPTADSQYYCHLTGSDLSQEQIEKQTIAAVELLARTLQKGEEMSGNGYN
ncbi:MAG: hypothetical protein K2J06_06515 [Muribaculaceae bacterium]|nr:hypothetical protein [Muribaculaceae bacterium]